MDKGIIAQPFGANKSASFYGTCGHTGIDEVRGYGKPVFALKKGVVYKILDDQRPANDGSGYWGVFIIGENKDGTFCEWQIGHLSKIRCVVGQEVDPWTIIGEEGNKGQVSYNGVVITKAMQDAGNKNGSHVHWNKKPLIKRTEKERDLSRGMFLTQWGPSMTAYKDAQGFYYEVVGGGNSCNGSVDPAKDLEEGYAELKARFDSQIKVAKTSLEVATQAAKYPALIGGSWALVEAVRLLLSHWF